MVKFIELIKVTRANLMPISFLCFLLTKITWFGEGKREEMK